MKKSDSEGMNDALWRVVWSDAASQTGNVQRTRRLLAPWPTTGRCPQSGAGTSGLYLQQGKNRIQRASTCRLFHSIKEGGYKKITPH